MKKTTDKAVKRGKTADFLKKNGALIWLLAVLTVILCALLTASSIARYVSETNAPWGEETDINYTVNSVFEVKTQEDLFSAINQGYSYVQLSKDIENPLIITKKAETLGSDLILDLNGAEIQRNGHEPILNVKEGVRLTVVDTSSQKSGVLYNPVGSVFFVNGGALTVVAGAFESGPRYSEYYSYNSKLLTDASNTIKKTDVLDVPQQVQFVEGGNVTIKSAPIFMNYPLPENSDEEHEHEHGNIYFDIPFTQGDLNISADTYCYYKAENDYSAIDGDPATSDWHYIYYIKESNHQYYAPSLLPSDNPEDFVKITIYGYENVIGEAQSHTEYEDYYAAIKMWDGTLDVQNGSFFSYFGVNTTACVNASGGQLTIKGGNFSTRVPDAGTVSYGTIMAKEKDLNAFNNLYFNNFEWQNTTNTEGAKARAGEAYCILNGGDATVTVGNGRFYASNNNIINMKSGNLTLTGGNFTKRNTIELTGRATRGAGIYMLGGTLTISDTEYTIIGDYTAGVYMRDGMLKIDDTHCTVRGSDTFGIYSLVSGNNHFVVTDSEFIMTEGVRQTGIYAANGTVNLAAAPSGHSEVFIEGEGGKGIHTENGGSVVSDNYCFELMGANSYGIYSTGGSITVMNGDFILESNQSCYGIYAANTSPAASIDIHVDTTIINIGHDTADPRPQGQTYAASIGVYLASANPANSITLRNTEIYSYEIGVALAGGQLNVSGTGTVHTKRASAIAVSEGNLSFAEDSRYIITSANTTTAAATNTYNITLPMLKDGVINAASYPNTDGIYVRGGSISSMGELTIDHMGLRNGTDYDNYAGLVVTSYAVRVVGGSVVMHNGKITAEIGGGIYCSGGDITMGIENTSSRTDVVVRTLGELMGDVYDAIGEYVSDGWQSYKSLTGGPAIELHGGNITVYNGTYEAAFGNGVLAKGEGTINIHDGVFNGWMGTLNNALSGKSGPAAYYGLKVIGGATVNIFNGNFDGGNGGAFITGIDTFNSKYDIPGKMAYVYIHAGTFGHEGTTLLDGFNIYDLATVVFGASAKVPGASASAYRNMIKVYAQNAPIAANKITYNGTSKESVIKVYYGTYDGNVIFNQDNFADFDVYNTVSAINYVSIPTGTTYTAIKNPEEEFYQ